MAFWSRLLGRKDSPSISSSLDLFREVYGSKASRTGEVVNWWTALQVSTVLACCKVIAEGVSQIPFRVYQQTDTGKKVATDHPVNELVYRKPNSWQTAFEFRETLCFHILLAGNAFIFVNRVGRAREVRELIPIEPGRVEVTRNPDLSILYKVRPQQGGDAKVIPQDAIWHLRGPSWNAWMGLEATKMAREAIGLSLAIEGSQADFQKNGGKTSGLYSVPDKLSPEKYALLRAWFEQEIAKTGAYRPLILDGGANYTSNIMTGVDAQVIETRRNQVEEICRNFRVMPIMVGHPGTAPYASAESLFLAHVTHTLAPWYDRIEQSADVNLLTPAERAAGFYTRFTPNALMRGAAADRAKFYSMGLGSGGTKGWLTQNDVRDFEEMDRSDDPEADKLPQPTTKPTQPPVDPNAPPAGTE